MVRALCQKTGSMIGGKLVEYGYLWWLLSGVDPIHKGAFEARGIFGQLIYIDRKEHLVVVVLSARGPSQRG